MLHRPVYLVSVTPADDPDVIHLPLQKIRLLHPDIHLEKYDAVFFTSKQSIAAMQSIAPEWKRLPVLCVGEATAAKAVAAGAEVLAVADGYGRELYDLVRQRYASLRWLYPRPERVASDFASRLADEGIAIDEAVVYRTECDPDAQTPVVAENAVLIFTSPSAYACFMAHYALQPTHAVVAIGKTTRKAIERASGVCIAETPSVTACIKLAKTL